MTKFPLKGGIKISLNKLILLFSFCLLFFLDSSFASERSERFDLIQYYNHLTFQEREAQSQDVDRLELEKMICLPFYESDDRNPFFVGWRNDRGDAFGIAHFQNSLMTKGFEFLIWFYDRDDGFYVVARESDLYNEGAYEIGFDRILINENRVAVVSFVAADLLHPSWPGRKVSNWLSWSKESGLLLNTSSLTALPTSYLMDLNNQDYLLAYGKNGNPLHLVINARNLSEVYTFDFAFIEDTFRKKRRQEFKEYDFYHVQYAASSWQCYLDDDSNVIVKSKGAVGYSGKKRGCYQYKPPCGNTSFCKSYSTEYFSYPATVDCILKLNGEKQITITGG